MQIEFETSYLRKRGESYLISFALVDTSKELCFIQILPGDRVKIEVSPYDSTKGHIIYRLHNKDLKD